MKDSTFIILIIILFVITVACFAFLNWKIALIPLVTTIGFIVNKVLHLWKETKHQKSKQFKA